MSDTELPPDGDKVPADEEIFTEQQQTVINKMLETQADTLTAKLTSHFGRISKEQVNKSLPDLEKLNEKLSNQILGGDPDGAVREILERVRKEEKELSQKKQDAIELEMEKFKDDPLFKRTKDDIKKIATEALKNGYPPAPAVEMAVSKAGRHYLESTDKEYNLGMVGQGKPPTRTKATKMPGELKKAAERDIRDGFFKDEAEYLAALSPAMKERYGI